MAKKKQSLDDGSVPPEAIEPVVALDTGLMPGDAEKRTAAAPKKKAGRAVVKTTDFPDVDDMMGMMEVVITGYGGSPLVINRMGQKVIQQIAEAQQSAVRAKRGERIPEADYENAKHLDERGRECIPCAAVASAFAAGGTLFEGVHKTQLRQAIWVVSPTGTSFTPLLAVPKQGVPPHPLKGEMFEAAVTIPSTGARTLAYRPMYKEWQAVVHIRLNVVMVNPQYVVKIMNSGGQICGIGEGRAGKTSTLKWGMFRVWKAKMLKTAPGYPDLTIPPYEGNLDMIQHPFTA